MLCQISTLFVLLGAGAAPAPKETVAVMPLRSARVTAETLSALNPLLTYAVDRVGTYKVISADDINALLGRSRMQEAAGCDDASCTAEIGAALGTRYVLTGVVDKLGANLFINLTLIDTKSQEARRGQAKVQDDENLYDAAITGAVRELFGAPAAPAASVAPAPPVDAVLIDGFDGTELDNSHFTRVNSGGDSVVAGGHVHVAVAAGGVENEAYDYAQVSSHGLWLLEGPLDVQVDFAVTSLALPGASGDVSLDLALYAPDYANGFSVSRRVRPGNRSIYMVASQTDGVWEGVDFETNATAGRFRIVREGKELTAFVGEGDGWRKLRTVALAWGSQPLVALFGSFRSKTTLEVAADFDNFVVSRGKQVVWGVTPPGPTVHAEERGCAALEGAPVLAALTLAWRRRRRRLGAPGSVPPSVP